MKIPSLRNRWFVPAPPPEVLLEKPPFTPTTVAYSLMHPDAAISDRPHLLVTALGGVNPRMAEMIDSTCSIAFLDGLFPVVVGSDLTTDFLVNAPMPVETLPRFADLPVLSALEYTQYVRNRWKIILGKWTVAETIDLANDIDGFVADELATKGAD